MKVETRDLCDFPTAVKRVGCKYDQLRHAVRYQRVVDPIIIGHCVLFTDREVESLREHFAHKAEEARCPE